MFFSADPVETGPAALELGVVDEATGAPVSGTAVLWRLDAPANATWQAGDQQQARIVVEEGVGRVRDLPEGLYRVLFEEQRGSTEDPPPFEVRAPQTDVTLRVPMPRRLPRSLRIVDERGQPLEEAWISSTTVFTGTIGGDPPPPDWARRRMLREPHPTSQTSPYAILREESNPKQVFASAGTFSLGEPEERIRTPKLAYRVRARVEGRNDVWIDRDAGPGGAEEYVAIALPLGTILRGWTLPDGSPVVGSKAKVDAACYAERVTAQTSPDRWLALTVHVRVWLEGYEPLEAFADADVPERPFPGWVRVGGRVEVR